MNYIEEALLRQGELLRQLAGTRGRAALEMREGERSPSCAAWQKSPFGLFRQAAFRIAKSNFAA